LYESGTTNYDGFMVRHLQVSREGKASRNADGVDVAARYLVYNLFVALSGTPETSRLLRDIDEKIETLARAVERGWIEVFDRRRKGGAVVRLVALTDEGRRMARRNLH
jgi:hypothetical protein